MAGRFAAAATRQGAAEAIRGWHVGRELPLLLKALRQPGVALLGDKMELLMVWEDATAAGRLRGDRSREQEVEGDGEGVGGRRAGWRPSRRNVFRFLRACWGEVGVERAMGLFGSTVGEAYLSVQYAQGFSSRQRGCSGAAAMEVDG
jgi:hypothetical protein